MNFLFIIRSFCYFFTIFNFGLLPFLVRGIFEVDRPVWNARKCKSERRLRWKRCCSYGHRVDAPARNESTGMEGYRAMEYRAEARGREGDASTATKQKHWKEVEPRPRNGSTATWHKGTARSRSTTTAQEAQTAVRRSGNRGELK